MRVVLNRQTLAKKPKRFLSTTGLLLGAMILSACGYRGAQYAPAGRLAVPKTEIVNVESGNISVTPPKGFCKDAQGSKNTETSAFIIFANCGYINSNGRRASNGARFSGLVTTSIAKEPAFQNSGNVAALADFLSTDQGLETLSTSGNTDTITIVDKRQTPDAVFLQLRDTDAALSQNVWKGFLNRSDQLVTVTLLQNKNTSLTSEQAMQFLQNYSKTIQFSTEQAPVQSVAKNQQNLPPTRVVTSRGQKNGLKKVGLLRRLLL
jgi:hypothetical protein